MTQKVYVGDINAREFQENMQGNGLDTVAGTGWCNG